MQLDEDQKIKVSLKCNELDTSVYLKLSTQNVGSPFSSNFKEREEQGLPCTIGKQERKFDLAAAFALVAAHAIENGLWTKLIKRKVSSVCKVFHQVIFDSVRFLTLKSIHQYGSSTRRVIDFSLVGKAFTNLSSLSINCTQSVPVWPDYALDSLSTLTGLTHLQISVDGLVRSVHMKPLSSLTNLRELNLSSDWRIEDDGIRNFCGLTQITNLKLTGCLSLTHKGIVYLCERIPLRKLDVSWCNLEHNFVAKLPAFNKSIEDITLEQCRYLTSFKGIEQMKNLTRLNVNARGGSLHRIFYPREYSDFNQLLNLKELVIADMENPQQETDTLKIVSQQCPQLESLQFRHLSGSFQGLRGFTNLTSLVVQGTIWEAHVYEDIQQLTSLKSLSLNGSCSDAGCLENLFCCLPNLQSLETTFYTGSVDEALRQLGECSRNLTKIEIKATRISNNGICNMVTNLQKLKHLSINPVLEMGSVADIDDTALESIVQNLTELTYLSLSHWNLSANCASLITCLTGLKHLDLSYCSNVSESQILQMVEMPRLTELKFWTNFVNSNGTKIDFQSVKRAWEERSPGTSSILSFPSGLSESLVSYCEVMMMNWFKWDFVRKRNQMTYGYMHELERHLAREEIRFPCHINELAFLLEELDFKYSRNEGKWLYSGELVSRRSQRRGRGRGRRGGRGRGWGRG